MDEKYIIYDNDSGWGTPDEKKNFCSMAELKGWHLYKTQGFDKTHTEALLKEEAEKVTAEEAEQRTLREIVVEKGHFVFRRNQKVYDLWNRGRALVEKSSYGGQDRFEFRRLLKETGNPIVHWMWTKIWSGCPTSLKAVLKSAYTTQESFEELLMLSGVSVPFFCDSPYVSPEMVKRAKAAALDAALDALPRGEANFLTDVFQKPDDGQNFTVV